MKSKNIVAALAIIAISAIPLMAHQLENYNLDENLLKDVDLTLQTTVTDQQQNDDEDFAVEYAELTNNFNRFIEVMQDKSLVNQPEKAVGQTIFVAIDNLAQSILNLPESSRDIYTAMFASLSADKYSALKFHLAYNKKYTEYDLHGLFGLATGYTNQYLDGNSSIEKLLAKQINKIEITVEIWKPSQYDKSFLEIMNSYLKGSKGTDFSPYPALVLAIDCGKSIKYIEDLTNKITSKVPFYQSELDGIRHYAAIKKRGDVIEFFKDKDYLVNTKWPKKDGILIKEDGQIVEQQSKDKSFWKNLITDIASK